MKIALATLAVLLCIGIDSLQADLLDLFDTWEGFDGGMFGNKFSDMDSMKPLHKMFNTCCDANAKACMKTGSMALSEKRSNSGDYYEITMGTEMVKGVEVKVLKVKKNMVGPTKIINSGVFVINEKDEHAFDCRPYTMCNYDLSATTSVPIITYYGEAVCEGDSESGFDSDSSDDSNHPRLSNVINFDLTEDVF